MDTHLYGILDSDSSYSRLFANYLNNLSHFRNKFIVFTDVESLADFQHKDKLQILFLGENFDLSYILDYIDEKKIIILSDSNHKKDNCPCPSIVKYDSPEAILTRAIKLLSAEQLPQDKKKNQNSFFNNIINEDFSYDVGFTKYIGVYSPYSLDLQTFCALCTSLCLSISDSVLFLDMSRFSPINSAAENGGFSDIIFYYRSNKEALLEKFHTLISSYYNFDYIAPPRTAEDITSFPQETFSGCLDYLADKFAYNYIIINFGDYLTPLSNYIGATHRLIVPYSSESANSIDKLYSYLHLSGLSRMVPSVTGLPVEYYNPLNYMAAKDLTHLAAEVKAHSLFHHISTFVNENLMEGGMSDDRSNKKKSFTKGRYML